MRPVSSKELIKIAEDEGCVFDRQEGSHYIMTKPNLARPIVIPIGRNLHEGIVFNTAGALGISNVEMRNRILKLKVSKKKKKKKTSS